jgi:hypothetical protein
LLLNCCRQAGKSTVVALRALAESLWHADTRVLIVSRSLRQSTELFRIITDFYRQLGEPIRQSSTKGELLLNNNSRIVCLPCKEETIRGFSSISLLILDEAARVPDDLYRAVRPMLAVSNGRMICLSTPCGKRGFFYDCWSSGGDDWQRIEVPATKIPRIKPEFLVQERRAMGATFFRQEYLCQPGDFASHHELQTLPNAPPCLRCGLSLFRTREDAEHQHRACPKLGKFVAIGLLQEEHGKTKLTQGRQPTHTTWWAYKEVNRQSVFPVVEEII